MKIEHMTKRERLAASIAGQETDRVPVGFWRHWPGDDQNPSSLAAVTLDFQNRYDLDFIKFPVSSTYCVDDFGVKHEYRGSLNGDREYLSRVVQKPSDWAKIIHQDIYCGTYGWHLDALKRVIDETDENTPVIMTVFNPLAMAAYLAGDELLITHLRQYPEKVHQALDALSETCARFARACIDRGADGLFLSSRFASFEAMTVDEYRCFGRPYDLQVLNATDGGWFNVLHLHGQHPMLKELADYPVQAINWHDRTSDIDLSTAAGLFHGMLMGGIDQQRLLQYGSPLEVRTQVQDSIKGLEARRLAVTPGCTYSMNVPEANLRAMRQAV